MSDLLGTGGLRSAALAAWTAHPQRLREDANAEEDHARGYYRDRVVVELAQNAADAAVRSGRPGVLLLQLTGGERPRLVAANTGRPLDAAGLASLASLRASAKRDDAHGSVGRFGVGFAAVRSVADEVAVVSRSGAVHFSLTQTADLIAAEPALATEAARRAGSLPALRLPFEGPGSAPAGVLDDEWDTAVVLELRDAEALALVRAQLATIGDPLLLALPGLDEVRVEVDGVTRTVAHVADRWVVASVSGPVEPPLLADRPVEERGRTLWQVTWAAPRVGALPEHAGVVHAPTPTDEVCTVPALLVATFPLDPSRRHVATGPLTDMLVARSGEVFGDLLVACRSAREQGHDAPDPLDLVPRGWPAGPLDAAVRDAALDAAVRAPVLVAAGDGHGVAPRDAVVLAAPWTFDDRALALLGGWDPSLVRLTEARHDLVRLLGLRSVAMAEVVEQLPAQDPAWLHEIYDLFATAPADTLAELSTAPVPLVDGRVVHGARGLVLADASVDAQALEALVSWGLRVIDPLAAHPVLERLGAQRMDADALARSEVLRGRVLGEEGDGDDEEAAATVLLRLLATGPSGVQLDRPEPWWGEALLTAHDGELVPARGLTLPGSPSAGWSDPEVLPPVADALVERWGDALVGLGVRSGLVVVTVDDPIAAAGLDGWADYLDDCGLDDHEGLGSQDVALVAVADLDAIRPDGWPAALAALAAGEARRALEPVRLRDGLVPSYTVWWLRHRSGLGLERPFALAGARRTGVATLLEGPPAALDGLDAGLQRALGGVASGADLDATGLVRVLHGASGDVDLAVAVDVWRAVARLAGRAAAGAGAGEVDASMLADVEVLPVLDGSGARWAPADAVGVADAMWAQHPGVQPVVVVPTALLEQVADALDLDVASDRAAGRVTSHGTTVPTPSAVLAVVPDAPRTWTEHDDLLVDGEPVDWWVEGGEVHAATTGGLAAGLAHVTRPGWRDRIERLLGDPGALPGVLLDLAGDPWGPEPPGAAR